MTDRELNPHDRVPPQDLEAERSVLGSCLLMNEVIDDVSMIVQDDHFYAISHQRIWSTITSLWNSSKVADTVTVATELQNRGHLEDMGGPPYLVQVLETVPHAAHGEYYASIVREKWTRRNLISASQKMAESAFDGTQTIDEVVAAADQAVKSALEGVAGDAVTDMQELMLSAIDPQEVRQGLSTGFYLLDHLTGGGVFPGELIVIGARPSVGKTALAIRMSQKMACAGKSVLLVSLEQPKKEIAERLLSMEAGVDSYRMRRPDELVQSEHERLVEASNKLSTVPLTIWDPNDVTVGRIGNLARTIKRRKNGLDAIVIDYLQLVRPDDRRDPREQQVARMSRALKILAKDLDVPVIILAQLNRDSVKAGDKPRAPRLSDLRESGAIEQDADQVWLLWRPEGDDDESESNEVAAQLMVEKNRGGRIGRIDLMFVKSFVRFVEVDRRRNGPPQDPEFDRAQTTASYQQEIF